MVRRALRSRSYRKVKVRTPSGKVKLHFTKKKPNVATCAECGAVLKGVPTKRTSKMQNMPKSQKRPERPYGGVLCTKCTRVLFKEKAKNFALNA